MVGLNTWCDDVTLVSKDLSNQSKQVLETFPIGKNIYLKKPMIANIVDDICDSGETFIKIQEHLKAASDLPVENTICIFMVEQ